VSPELLDTQVNPAVWEISGHIVLKRRKDYDEASEENAWKLLAEVSLSEARFEEVKAMVFEAIGCFIAENGSNPRQEQKAEPEHPPLEAVDSKGKGSSAIVNGNSECLVLH